jgi:nucleoside phosphorylase
MVVMLTAQPEVFEAISERLTDIQEQQHSEGTIYQLGKFVSPSTTWRVAIAEIASGNNSAAMETERAISFLAPELALFVGLAGGLKDVKVGDVVASTKVYGIESGKVLGDAFELRPSIGNSSYGLEQRARAEVRKEDWLKRLVGDSRSDRPRGFVGAIAAGEKIIGSQNSDIAEFLKTNYSDTLAVEMEGRGFLEAVRANQSVEAIVICGVSNLLDDKTEAESSGSKIFAARHSAAFACELLAKLRPPSRAMERASNRRNRKPNSRKKNSQLSPTQRDDKRTFVQVDALKVVSVENLYSVLTSPPYCVVCAGGGASIKSGVPLSDGLVEKAVRWQHCVSQGLSFDDPRVILRLSDWMPDFRKHEWYREGPLGDNLPTVMRHLLQPRDSRREFFRHILDQNVPASAGYERLAEFMALGFVMTVMTPNFDSILPELCHRRRRPHYVDVINSQSTLRLLTTSPRYPLITYLYGSIEDYIDRFETEPPAALDQQLVHRLIPILRDHPLIVIGYRGAESVIMQDLLMKHASDTEYYHHGVYWCAQNFKGDSDLHPLVQEVAQLIRGNFQVVPIEGFDELMEQLWGLHQRHQQFQSMPIPAKIEPTEGIGPPTYDMEPIDGNIGDELDWPNLKARLVNYCNVWEIPVPEVVTREWLIEELCRQHLALEVDELVRPTKAGYLLFGRKPHQRMPSSITKLRVSGEPEQRIEGSLWNQLALINDALAEANKPFILKGDKSETVYPYPPTALREIVVNALVHRTYDSSESVVIEISADVIRVMNPGGLVEEVIRQTEGASILSQIQQGVRGIKGYRNPVIADLFYSSHDMEKAGSGLADVHRLVTENGGKVAFGPIESNAAFEVLIHSRPEAVDRQTGTASVVKSTRYAANLLEVGEIPQKVWQAPTEYQRARELWADTTSPWLPPFIIHGQHIHTFFDLTDAQNPLRDLVDPKRVQSVTFEEFSKSNEAERKLVWLMNECLYKHLESRGLIVDKYRRRAHFPRTNEGLQAVSYQARLRRSKRTVTKPIISPANQKTRYWEHQSCFFSFERFEDTWALQLLPGYVFTLDGYRNFLAGERVNILSTKRASRDYNSKVHTDLVFWAWVLSKGQQGAFALEMGPSREDIQEYRKRKRRKRSALNRVPKFDITQFAQGRNHPQFLIRSALPSLTVYALEEASDDEDDFRNARERAELAELEEELGALADEFGEPIQD